MSPDSVTAPDIGLGPDAVRDCTEPGQDATEAVTFWAARATRPDWLTPAMLASYLEEFGAWDDAELADDAANWHRFVWIVCGNAAEGES